MTTPHGAYPSAAAFRRAVSDRLRMQAAREARPVNELRREFLYQRFLARIFAEANSPWVLKGGVGLLARLPDARHSRDIDLYRPEPDLHLNAAVADLGTAIDLDAGDHLRFVIETTRPLDGDASAAVRIAAYAGATVFDRFIVDLSLHLRPLGGVDRVRPAHVLDLPGLPEMPELRLYPITDQLADKICAMYGRYGDSGAPSSRYRDLVDIVLTLRHEALDAADVRHALRRESARRDLDLPAMVALPSASWAAGYRAVARDSRLPAALQDPDAAVNLLAALLQPLIDGHDPIHAWDPGSGRWRRGK